MRLFIFTLLCVASAAMRFFNEEELAELVRSHPHNTSPTPESIKLAFTKPIDNNLQEVEIPENFDLRTQYPQCTALKTVMNQQTCGSCWTFSSTGMASDRACISGTINTIFSPQYQLSCDHSCFGTSPCQGGCEGGYLALAFQFQRANGLATRPCVPYENDDQVACPTECTDGTPLKKWYPTSYSRVSTEQAMQLSLLSGGSLSAIYQVYADNMEYEDGVYVHQSTQSSGYHAIKIIGWGVDSNTQQKYWWYQNSWGTSWGIRGYGKILRGTNECGIESDVWEATFPRVDNCAAYTTCENCSSQSQCGWCRSSKTCLSGTAEGPSSEDVICPEWSYGTCVVDDCFQYSSSCTTCAGRRGCGWCLNGGAALCAVGDASGPTQLVGGPAAPVCSSWVSGTLVAAGNDSCPTDSCSAHSTCSACGADSGCGWCGDNAQCISGTDAGPTLGSCNQWSRGSQLPCPSDSCANYGSCATCTSTSGCSWCASLGLGKCMSSAASATCSTAYGPGECPSCAGQGSCATCTPLDGCGWCESTQSCEMGSLAGLTSVNQTCAIWSKTACAGHCANHLDCAACARDPECGWCGARSICMRGKYAGADSADCPHDWKPYKMMCPYSSGVATMVPPIALLLTIFIFLDLLSIRP